MDEILAILASIKPHIQFENEKAIVDDGLLDSFDILVLVGELNNELGISISAADIEPKNFNSVEAIQALLQSLK